MESDSVNPFIIGKYGAVLTEEEKSQYLKLKPLGFILYHRNLYQFLGFQQDQAYQESYIKTLTQDLKNLFPTRDVQIWIDEEGGANSNLQHARISYCENLRTSYEFYALYKEKGYEYAEKAVYDQFFATGKKLKELGFTGTFAPVADIFYEGKSRIVGDRSFGPDVDLVIKFCKTSIQALKDAKIDCCIKHFPGHGLASVDSHRFLPIVKESEEFLLKNDFRVFKELAPFVKYAMTAHITYECIDKKNPMTLSKKGLDYMRKNLGFENIKIITDAIDMMALYYATNLPYEGSSTLKLKNMCLEAGCDVVLYCNPSNEVLDQFLN